MPLMNQGPTVIWGGTPRAGLPAQDDLGGGGAAAAGAPDQAAQRVLQLAVVAEGGGAEAAPADGVLHLQTAERGIGREHEQPGPTGPAVLAVCRGLRGTVGGGGGARRERQRHAAGRHRIRGAVVAA